MPGALPLHLSGRYRLCSGEIWDELLNRFKVELAHPNTGAAFRGSLIDEKMFAIDVAEWGKRDILEEQRSKLEVIRRETESAA